MAGGRRVEGCRVEGWRGAGWKGVERVEGRDWIRVVGVGGSQGRKGGVERWRGGGERLDQCVVRGRGGIMV